MQNPTQVRCFTLPASSLKYVLACAVLLFAGCGVSEEEAQALRSAARKGEIPTTLGSPEAATTYAHALFAGGQVDQVRIGLRRYLVLFTYGSGIPVIELAVYRWEMWHWELVAKRLPPTHGFMSAKAANGKIVAVVGGSTQTWPLYDPAEPKNQRDKLPTARFSQEHLSREQLLACVSFRAKAGTTRQMEWDDIQRIGALPIYAFKMSQDDIVRLLGEPARRELREGQQELWYALEQTQRQAFLVITFRGGYAIMVGTSATIS